MHIAATLPAAHHDEMLAARAIAAAVGTIVVVDAMAVGAPGLALLAVPFAVAALRFTGKTTWGTGLEVALAGAFLVIGINYIAANGFDAEWGDLLFAYVGTPLCAALAVIVLRARRATAGGDD